MVFGSWGVGEGRGCGTGIGGGVFAAHVVEVGVTDVACSGVAALRMRGRGGSAPQQSQKQGFKHLGLDLLKPPFLAVKNLQEAQGPRN